MTERTEQGQRTPGRRLDVHAYGNTADEMELMALDEARLFFGPDVRLEVVRDYEVRKPLTSGQISEAEERKAAYWSDITVRTVEG